MTPRVVAALAAVLGVIIGIGCGGGPGNRQEKGAVVAKAEAAEVTYYYLPG